MGEDYLWVQSYFAFVYHTLFLLFRNTQRDGTRMQEKGKGHVQGRKRVDKDEGRDVGEGYRQVQNYLTFVFHI